ncbi:MarR family transcriptional regulator [Thiotrichales bacterium 19S9-12]|nr:MarR family transcriptional regulator [Thiotrichales bacterium 19S9-11]MCF6811763.1 MarR family transcriptional regulator [Thiotrichales bacterium 19S9-12]
MKPLTVGIISREAFQERALLIASGKYQPKKNEPKVWFNSIKSLAEVLSDNNVELLKLIEEKHPKSIKELSELSGRKSSNLSRTLKTLEKYSIIELIKKQREVQPVVKATNFNILYSVA